MKAIAMITPSANVVVERLTMAVLADFPEASGHFTRVPVHGAHDPLAKAYDWDTFLDAARLLADAEPDVIVWNGTLGASFGFDVDRELCRRITEATGVPATTATLAVERLLRALHAKRIAMVTPYDDVYQRNIVATYRREGFPCRSEVHAGLSDNIAYSRVPEAEIADMARRAEPAAADALVISCTNLPGAPLIAAIEREYGVPALDSTLCAIYEGLRLAGVGWLLRGARWGRVFAEEL
jgi:maleate isomerase